MHKRERPPLVLSRQELYDRVWAVSAVQLAKEIGVSDVAIAKACKRHQIPKPPLGYWAKVAAGHSPERPPLPVVVDPALQALTFTPPASRPRAAGDTDSTDIPTLFVSPEVKELFERVIQQPPSWEVPDNLRAAHPAVSATRAALQRWAKERRRPPSHEADLLYPLRSDQREALFDVHVGRDSVERACRLLQGLMTAALAVGFKLDEGGDSYRREYRFTLFDFKAWLHVREITRRAPHTPTAQALSGKHHHTTPKWEWTLTGRFGVTLLICDWKCSIAEWQDGKVRPVEQMLREVVHRMLAEVDRHCVQARAAREHERRQREEARARQLEEERRQREQRRVDELVNQVERWEMARRIRRYLGAVRRQAVEQHGAIKAGSRLDQWLRWASEVASRNDPLPPLLDQKAPR